MISICCPTRNRLPRLKEMMSSALQTAGIPIELAIYVDDDQETLTYLKDFAAYILPKYRLVVVTGERGILSRYWNDCADKANGNILMLANDDIVFLTQGWAQRVEEEFKKIPDRIAVVHCNNLQHNASTFATHPFVHRKWVEAAGYFVPPCFPGDHTDTWICAVSDMIQRRIYLGDVTIEHRHWTFNKSAKDRTYEERADAEGGTRDLYDSLKLLRELMATKLRTVMR